MMSEAIPSSTFSPLPDPAATKTTRTSQKKMSMNRRQDRRRLATFKINNGLAVRHIPTTEEVLTFIQSIELNDVSKFGLVKLSNCVLDLLYTHPYREEEVVTLIRLAALAKRDAIVNSLLNAQADPTVFCCQCAVSSVSYSPSNGCDSTVSLFVSERIRKIFKPLAVLFIRKLMDMKQLLIQHIQSLAYQNNNNTSNPRCQACLLSNDVERKGGCRGKCCLLLFESCQHVLCEACYWMHAVVWDDHDDAKSDEDIVCPVCQATSLSTSLSALSIINNDRQMDSTSVLSILSSSPQDIADRSKSLYDQLAEGNSDTQPHKRFQFRAMTRKEAACVHLGIKQSHRDDELLKAAAMGNRRRLQALVDIGIDINKTNEYGQGALFISTWLGHQTTAMFLIACGADVNQCDNAGVSVLSTAIASGSTLVVDALLRNPIAHPLSSSWCNITIQDNQLCKPSVISSIEECCRKDMHVTCLIGNDVRHQGAGSIYIDNAFTDAFLDELEALFPLLPIAPSERGTGESATRSYFCDALGRVKGIMEQVLQRLSEEHVLRSAVTKKVVTEVLPHMRFLHYDKVGGSSAPHIDLCRTTKDGLSSTFTFILYLTDCTNGGATNLLRCVCPIKGDLAGGNVLARVEPKRGRLLIFPHVCPHEGEKVVHVPKLLLRGEMV